MPEAGSKERTAIDGLLVREGCGMPVENPPGLAVDLRAKVPWGL